MRDMSSACGPQQRDLSCNPRLVELARCADWLVHDAQYTAEEPQKRAHQDTVASIKPYKLRRSLA